MELILIIVLFILAILYWIELFKNIKLEKERDIETFEKNKLERKVKKLESDEHRSYLIQKITEKNIKIADLNSKVQSRDKTINNLKKKYEKRVCKIK